MKTIKPLIALALVLFVISMACSSLQPVPPTATMVPATFTPAPPTLTPTITPSRTAMPPTPAHYPSRIAYSDFVAGEGIFIHTVDADGQNDIRLTLNDCIGALPAWSTDGSLIAYYCYDSDHEKANLWVMNADGSNAHFVAALPDLFPFVWSPDNKFVVYHGPQPDGSENDIYILDLASGKITDITRNSPVWDAFPDWSPNGDLIAFTSDRGKGGKVLDDVWVMKPDGTGLVNLTDNGEDWEDYHPVWSPDGSRIAFFRTGSLFNENAEGGPAGLWTMSPDGTNQQLVAAIDGFRASGVPVWSPDGQYLAYAFELGDNEDVWVVPAAGGDPINLSNMPGQKTHISWSPDSQALIFTNNNDEEDTLAIYLATVDGSDVHLLLSHEKFGYGDWAP